MNKKIFLAIAMSASVAGAAETSLVMIPGASSFTVHMAEAGKSCLLQRSCDYGSVIRARTAAQCVGHPEDFLGKVLVVTFFNTVHRVIATCTNPAYGDGLAVAQIRALGQLDPEAKPFAVKAKLVLHDIRTGRTVFFYDENNKVLTCVGNCEESAEELLEAAKQQVSDVVDVSQVAELEQPEPPVPAPSWC